MKIIYDSETDTLTLIFHEGEVKESDEVREGIILDYDEKGRVVSIEVLEASKHITEPRGIIYELKALKKAAHG